MNRTKYFTIIVIFTWPISAVSGLFGPSNYWECILENMPGMKNNPAAIEVRKKCRKEFYATQAVEKKSPLFGVKTSGECVIKYAKDVSSPLGAKLIRSACYKLYQRE